MRRLAIVLVATGIVVSLATTAQAESGWARFRDHWVRYEFTFQPPAGVDSLNPRVYILLHERAKLRAIAKARRANDLYHQKWEEARKLVMPSTLVTAGAGPYCCSLTYWLLVHGCEEPNWEINVGNWVSGFAMGRDLWNAEAPKVGVGLAPPSGGGFQFSITQQVAVANQAVRDDPGMAAGSSRYPWPGYPHCGPGNYSGW